MNAFDTWDTQNLKSNISGRYITNDHIEKLLADLGDMFSISTLGYSVENRPIHAVTLGSGPKRILSWSQMHGNESTTTKAVFDCFNFFSDTSDDDFIHSLLKECTFLFIPILNPDGAYYYTRNNANDVDLNRDAFLQTQAESKVLITAFKTFQPDFCFNLHDQRSIYGFKESGSPSVLSFLAPSADEERSVTLSRKQAMSIVGDIHDTLKAQLPGQIGRYNDAYNINCAGDFFQTHGVPTILFEAGHHPEDYQREETRRYIFMALLTAFRSILHSKFENAASYSAIPEHQNCFVDILVTNARLDEQEHTQIAIRYIEMLKSKTIEFVPVIEAITSDRVLYGHRTINAQGKRVMPLKDETLTEGSKLSGIQIEGESTITF